MKTKFFTKKFMALLLIFAMIFSSMPLNTFAADVKTDDWKIRLIITSSVNRGILSNLRL